MPLRAPRAHVHRVRSHPATDVAVGNAAVDARAVALPGRRHRRRLDNGLDVLLLEMPGAAVVSTTLWFRVGSRDEPAGHAGVAHFLEHMMFKGSPAYGPGQVDRRTQALGGSNNAYTSHDTTVYYFKLAPRVWHEALAIESDRMQALLLEPHEVSSERQVILEEVAMYESDPWDALEQEVASRLYGDHVYGRPVLGTRADLLATDEEHLRGFHRDFYRPDGAALVVAGAVSAADFAAIERTLGGIAPGLVPRPPLATARPLVREERVERRHGEVPRLLLAMAAPPADHADHPALRLLATALADGRTSRLRHDLVEERELCLFADADVSSVAGPGVWTVEAELHEGVAPADVESRVRDHLRAVIDAPLAPAELARARAALLADWVFGNEQAHQQALSLGFGLTLFGDDAEAEKSLQAAVAASAEEVQAAAARWLDVETNPPVVGWAVPKGKRKRGAPHG